MKICDAIAKAKDNNERAIGGILSVIAGCSDEAREIIEQDLDNKQMSLGACFNALKAHARKNAQGGCWACPVLQVTPENEAVKVICDFYKIPEGWNSSTVTIPQSASPTAPFAQGSRKSRARVDLMDLL